MGIGRPWRFWQVTGPSGFGASSTAEQVTKGVDASNLVAIVTGATSGLGKETARVLALRGATVIMTARNVEIGLQVRKEILEQVPNAKLKVMELDLSSLDSVKSFAAAFVASNYHLHILMYRLFTAYAQSKLANILHAKELSRRLQEEAVRVTTNSLHPGEIPTNIARHMKLLGIIPVTWIKPFLAPILPLFLKNVQQGAATTCYVALHPNLQGVSGKYFSDCNEKESSAYSRDADLAKRLWDFSEEMINAKLG